MTNESNTDTGGDHHSAAGNTQRNSDRDETWTASQEALQAGISRDDTLEPLTWPDDRMVSCLIPFCSDLLSLKLSLKMQLIWCKNDSSYNTVCIIHVCLCIFECMSAHVCTHIYTCTHMHSQACLHVLLKVTFSELGDENSLTVIEPKKTQIINKPWDFNFCKSFIIVVFSMNLRNQKKDVLKLQKTIKMTHTSQKW